MDADITGMKWNNSKFLLKRKDPVLLNKKKLFLSFYLLMSKLKLTLLNSLFFIQLKKNNNN